MFRRMWIIIAARNKEFYRDRSAFMWNILFPILIVLGFSMIFNDNTRDNYKVGYIDSREISSDPVAQKFFASKKIDFLKIKTVDAGLDKLNHHRIDMLVDFPEKQYYVSHSSPKGYVAEQLFSASQSESIPFEKKSVSTREIPYLEWLFPGILAMNIMFGALWGVGYVIIRYRKNGALKRMSVTPVHPWEFLTAQVISRLFVLVASSSFVFILCSIIYKFKCKGSYALLALIFILGTFCLISMGLLVAARSSSEEFANGMINLLTWPMMFLSEVWFSLEGSYPLIKKFALIFPLTHMTTAARKVMNDGATFMGVLPQISVLAGLSVVFLVVSSFLFKWKND